MEKLPIPSKVFQGLDRHDGNEGHRSAFRGFKLCALGQTESSERRAGPFDSKILRSQARVEARWQTDQVVLT